MPKKIDTFRSPVYLDWIRSQKCIICERAGVRQRGRTDPHHTEGRGKAIVGGDTYVLPVCRAHHPQSPLAFKTFCREHDIDYLELLLQIQNRFCEEQGYEIGRDGQTFIEILTRAGLGEQQDLGKRVSNGTAKSKSTKVSKLRPLSVKTNQFDGKQFRAAE